MKGVCKICGCTDTHACLVEGGPGDDILTSCHWVDLEKRDLCSKCEGENGTVEGLYRQMEEPEVYTVKDLAKAMKNLKKGRTDAGMIPEDEYTQTIDVAIYAVDELVRKAHLQNHGPKTVFERG